MWLAGHVLSGALVCRATGNPILGSVASLATHLVVDSGPQLGTAENLNRGWMARRIFNKIPVSLFVAVIDLATGFGILAFLVSDKPDSYLFWLGGIVGILPDFCHLIHLPVLEKVWFVKLLKLPPFRQIEALHNRVHSFIILSHRPVLYWLYVFLFLGGCIWLIRLVP